MNRRLFLSAAALAGCGGETEEDDLSNHVATSTPPWHMWGNKKTANVVFNSLLTPLVTTTEQLANVQAKRPDTWRFFFAATLVSMAPPVAGGLDLLSIDFDLAFGVGLATQLIQSFAHFEFDPGTDLGKTIWTSTGVGPKRTATDVVPNITSELVAQTIQCNARLSMTGAQLGTAQVEIASYFAPNVHVRPDWFLHEFNGELGGR